MLKDIDCAELWNGKICESDSESVLNQRNMLMNFVKEKDFIFVGEYVDVTYSGTDFDISGTDEDDRT